MIPAPPNLIAVYRCRDAEPRPDGPHAGKRTDFVGNQVITLEPGEYLSRWETILAFDDEGEPLIIEKGSLIPASSRAGFVGVGEPEPRDARIVQIIPAIDWVVWRVDNTGPWSNHVVAWGLTSVGTVVALESNSGGTVERLSMDEKNNILLTHISESEQIKGWIAARLGAKTSKESS